MGVQSEQSCPGCGRSCSASDALCPLCGHLFRIAKSEPAPQPYAERTPRTFELDDDPVADVSMRFFWLGALTAPLFAFLPLLDYMGWFLSALTHALGHSIVAWVLGMPAYPAIRLDGHAAAFHEEQKLWLVGFFLVAGIWSLWQFAPARRRMPLVAGFVALYAFLALTPARDVAHLLGGHLGELVFAAIFFGRNLSGGTTETNAERVLYGTVAWYLAGSNAVMTFRLATSEAARLEYASSGSFGLRNDYLRIAEDHLGVPLPLIAFVMTVVAIAVPLVVLAAWTRLRRAH